METGSVPVRRRGRIALAAAAPFVGSLLLAAAPATAHALVVGTNPQAGARIAHAPAELRVAFSEAVRPLGQGLTLQGPRGRVQLGPVLHPDGRPEVLAATLPTLGDGSYLAGWRIVSADDGHLEAGSFAFAIGTGSGPVTSPAPPQLPTPWQVTGRWLETAGVLWLVGIAVAALTAWRRPAPIGPDEPRWWALTVAAITVGAVGLAWQVAAGAATTGSLGPGAVGAFLAASPATGRRMLVELVLLAATAALVWWRVRRGRRPGLGAFALAAGAGVALALGAHDTGLTPRWLFVPLEVVHLLAVGTWIGGLAVLALTARRARLEAVRRFSVLALRAVIVVAVTGAWQGLAQVSSRAALTSTDYGRVLALKAAIFLVVLGLAAVARFRLLPHAGTHGVGAPGGLRRLLAVEASGGAVIVLVAALLANTVPAGDVLAAASANRVRGGLQTQQLQAGPLRLQLRLEPGTVGRNLLQIHVTEPTGRPVDGLPRIDLTVADQAGRAAPAPLRAPRVAPATYRAATDAFALAGTWRVGIAIPGASPGLAASFTIATSPATITPQPLRVLGPDGRALPALVQPCGDGCAEAFLARPTRGPLLVEAVLPNKGTARFTLPWPLPRPAPGRLRAADHALAASRSFRIHEVLTAGLGTVFRTDYVLAAPNRARWHLDTGNSTADTVWIDERRWMRDGNGPWKLQSAPGLQLRFPARNWSDQATGVVDLGPATWHHTPARVLAFVDPANSAYHRLWVDPSNRILHERMDAPGHFMDRDYASYGTPVTITQPRQP